jgi:hypothetical protein
MILAEEYNRKLEERLSMPEWWANLDESSEPGFRLEEEGLRFEDGDIIIDKENGFDVVKTDGISTAMELVVR